MPKHSFAPILGQIDRFVLDSKLLENRLGDPTSREILVHIPPKGMDLIENGEKLPAIIYLAPFTSSGPARAGWKAFSESILQRHERLVESGKMLPCILVLPDTFTSLGGNQFVDSPVLGNWSTWLSSDLKDSIIQRYSCNGKFGLVGKSSGGYGAIYNALVKPEQWGGVVSHSGDVGFETMFMSTFSETLTHLSRYGSPAKYVDYVLNAPRMSSDDFHTLMICAMAASYDPGEVSDLNPLGIHLPVDLDLCEIDNVRWAKWLEFDTLTLIESKSNNLKSLNLLFIDCGNQDQYGIQYGSRKLTSRLTQLGIEHVWQEFDGTHSGIDYRLDTSLPLLSKSLHS
jgi:hypothetical protein